MTDYADIYFLDGRNATATVNRQQGGAQPGHVVVGGGQGTVIRAASPYGPYGAYGHPMMAPGYWGPPSWGPQAAFGPQPPWAASALGASVFGRMSTGQLVDMVAQIFVALMPLPAAPVATQDPATDVGNLILYQSSLASYAKRDEQVRTLGNLVQKLVG